MRLARRVPSTIAVSDLVGYGWIGFMDDYAKVTRKRNLGLSGRVKLIYQFLFGFVFGATLLVMHAYGDFSTAMNIPFIKNYQPSLLIPSLLHNPWTYALGVAPSQVAASIDESVSSLPFRAKTVWSFASTTTAAVPAPVRTA